MPDYPLDDLREARHARDKAEALVTELVVEARRKGYSWERIAQILGVTRSGAWQRYGKDVDPHPPAS